MKKLYVLLECVFCFLIFNTINVEASIDDFVTFELPSEEKNRIIERINLHRVSEHVSLDSLGLPLYSFDVSEEDKIVVTMGAGKIAIIDGRKITGFYEFETNGGQSISYFQVAWKGDHIIMFTYSYFLEFTQDGKVVDVAGIENGDDMYKQMLRREIENNGVTYRIKNDVGLLNFFSRAYSQLVKIDQNDRETVIYDISTYLLIKKYWNYRFLFFLVFFVSV